MCCWTKVVLASFLATIGCSRREAENSRLLELRTKCRDDGAKVQVEWKAAHPSATAAGGHGELTTLGGWLATDEYTYEPRSNTCLWSGEYRGAHGPLGVWHVKIILDVYTNKPLIQFVESDGKQVGDVTEVEFERRKTALFGSIRRE